MKATTFRKEGSILNMTKNHAQTCVSHSKRLAKRSKMGDAFLERKQAPSNSPYDPCSHLLM